jgi:uncharacterized membrane protein YdjX (TVP38/TMEM64 family)
MNQKLINTIKITVFTLTFGAMIFIAIYYAEFFLSLRDLEVRQALRSDILSMGVEGWFYLLLIQLIQVFVAFLPSEPVELLMGMVYGTWGGLLIGLTGVFIGSIIAYYFAKIIGVPFFKLFIKKNYLEKYEFLQDEKRVAFGVFIVYFTVGTPSDVVTYLAPTLKIKPWKFFLISTLSRIPKIITSTFIGHHFVEGNTILSISVFIATAMVGLISIIIYRLRTKTKSES